MAKRGNGEGSIYFRKDGRFMGSISVGRDSDGKLIRKTVYDTDKKVVQESLNKLAKQLYTSSYCEPSTLRLGDWLMDWLDNYKTISLKPATYDLYESMIEKVIEPEIGHLKLKDIKPIHIQTFFNKLYKKGSGYSTSTLQKIKNILAPAMETAVTNELIGKNPLDSVELPKYEEKEVRALTDEEQQKLVESAKKNR